MLELQDQRVLKPLLERPATPHEYITFQMKWDETTQLVSWPVGDEKARWRRKDIRRRARILAAFCHCHGPPYGRAQS